ncbi:DNA repair protein endonuclease SAE2/CtIP C-terminus-domain-containing protein [Aspergillus foveolatus]|uniref:DNA repair protein endonuclease SAE2/CtIP C-terminus-domain-containing protein n=1 Tax=Aspergillus foveolatus TaxID=210207 RepID=UPI003CCE29A8
MDILQQLHLSLTQSTRHSFDTAYTGLNAELATYHARVKDAEERTEKAEQAHQKAAAEVQKLKHEISLLQEQLRKDEVITEETEKAAESALRLDETYEPGRVLGNTALSELDAADLRRISDRYIELYQQAAIIVQASGKLRGLVKRHKTKVARLKALLQRQEPTSVLDGKSFEPYRGSAKSVKLGNPELQSPTANLLNDPARVPKKGAPSGSPLSPTSETTGGQSCRITKDVCDGASKIRLQERHQELLSTPSDASTDELPAIGGAGSNVVVETLKRKRTAPAQSESKSNPFSGSLGKSDSLQPILVKSETLSSSPLMAQSPQPGPSGTQDLDDIGDTIVTPTKKIRFYSDQGYNITSENSLTTLKLASGRHAPLRNCTARANRTASNVLQPVDGNLRNLSAGQMANKKRTENLGSITRISSLAEDGDETRPLPWRRVIESPQSDIKARDSSRVLRLSNLLEGAPPTSPTLQTKSTTNASATTPGCMSHKSVRGNLKTTGSEAGAISTTTLATSDSPRRHPKARGAENNSGKLQPQPGCLSQNETIPDEEPYRARPLHQLGLENFRINPEYNNGLNYAYDEVVRKRDERKHASGCTRPGCCGEKFSAMARFGIPLDVPGKATSDREILEEYLGEEMNKINTLNSKIRDNLLVEAKTRVFANRFGKHRHQHHRSGTPPGFWRTEMPGTQELEEDREEAGRLEREKVQERYREAMRPGGLWKFADE